MLEEQKSSARPEHAACFPERTRLVVHSAENERRDDGVEGVVLERQILSRCPQHLRQGLVLAGLALKPAKHRRLRLGDYERVDAVVVREIGSGAAADLEDSAVGFGEQALAHFP